MSLSQGNTPVTPGAALLIDVVDERGEPVEEGTVEVSIEFEGDLAYYNYSYSLSLASNPDGLMGVSPPPSRLPATISMRVVTSAGRTSDTLVIRNDEYWFAFAHTETDFVGVHEFDLSKIEVTTNIKLVTIDIKPGSDPNSITLGSEDVISVAILTTPIFDAAEVDQSSLTLEGTLARVKEMSGNIGSFEDVDRDGDLDLVVQFPTADLQLTQADTEAILEGATLDGVPIQGVDSIYVV